MFTWDCHHGIWFIRKENSNLMLNWGALSMSLALIMKRNFSQDCHILKLLIFLLTLLIIIVVSYFKAHQWFSIEGRGWQAWRLQVPHWKFRHAYWEIKQNKLVYCWRIMNIQGHKQLAFYMEFVIYKKVLTSLIKTWPHEHTPFLILARNLRDTMVH
jgi:hypothetical protein